MAKELDWYDRKILDTILKSPRKSLLRKEQKNENTL